MDKARCALGLAAFLCLAFLAGVGVAQVATEAPQPVATGTPETEGRSSGAISAYNQIYVEIAVYELTVGSVEWSEVTAAVYPAAALARLTETGLKPVMLPRFMQLEGEGGAVSWSATATRPDGAPWAADQPASDAPELLTSLGTPGPDVVPAPGPDPPTPPGALVASSPGVYEIRLTPWVTSADQVLLLLRCGLTAAALPDSSAAHADCLSVSTTQALDLRIVGRPDTPHVVRGLFRLPRDPARKVTGGPLECLLLVTPKLLTSEWYGLGGSTWELGPNGPVRSEIL